MIASNFRKFVPKEMALFSGLGYLTLMRTSLILISLSVLTACMPVSVEFSDSYLSSFRCDRNDWKYLRPLLNGLGSSDRIIAADSKSYLQWSRLNEKIASSCPRSLLEGCEIPAEATSEALDRYDVIKGPIEGFGVRAVASSDPDYEVQQGYSVGVYHGKKREKAISCFDHYFAR